MAWESISVFILIPLIGILLFANGWFLKRLFDNLEKKISTYCQENHESHAEIKGKLENHDHKDGKVVFYEA